MDVIFKRRSVRAYLDKKIGDLKIEKMLRAAMQAPSAVNQQPWEFLIVQSKDMLKMISEMSPYSKIVSEAPLAIIALGNKDKMIAPDFWQQDLSASVENLLLEAVELNLGAVWLGVFPLADRVDYITQIFDLPQNIIPFAVISIGYPKNLDSNGFVDRYDSSKIKYEKYL
nr:nitroreductase family protein [Methanococcus maripaludis]